MMHKRFKQLFAALLLITMAACKKGSDDAPQSNARTVKYEITGNFTGKFIVVYSDNVNGNTTLTNVSLPWSKEINYPPGVLAIGISAQASVNGTAGQAATLKIYSGGTAVRSSTSTAGTQGEVTFPSLGYTF